MQRKRHINFKLHSIPILLNMKKSASRNNSSKKSNVLYSIPRGCVLALLFVGIISFLPDMIYNSTPAYAATETFGDSTASMTLDTSDIEVTVAPGETGYASKNIQLSINNVKDYALTITAPASLSEQNTTTSQATSWGYAYGQSGELASMSYTNFTGSAQTLESGNTNTTSNKTLALAAKFSDHNTAGHYKANITLALTATPKVAITYTLSYNANGTNVTNLPSSQQCTAYDNGTCTITIPNTTPTRTGYEFLGWADTSNATTAQYQPNTTIPMSTDKTIYGVWKGKLGIWSNGINSGITTMQQMNSSICNNATTNTTMTLSDNRAYPDGVDNTYTIAKLADGKCWMTQNLRITGTIHASGSDFSSPSSITIPNSRPGITVANRYALQGYTYTPNPNAGLTGYYNWYTATAQSGNSSITTATDVSNSICPSGWTLPTGAYSTNGNMFYNLFNAMDKSLYKDNTLNTSSSTNWSNSASSLEIIQGEPYNFNFTGYVNIYSNDFTNDNTGHWWTRTAQKVNEMSGFLNAYTLAINDSSISPGTANNERASGYAIRCIAK